MTDKSYVTMETTLCPICGKEAETGNLLLDRNLRERFEMKTPTHWDLCPEHKKLHEDGFIALVEVLDNTKGGGTLNAGKVHRTGLICHLRRSVAETLFGEDFPVSVPLVFVEVGFVQAINDLVSDTDARQENAKILDEAALKAP